MNIIDVENSQKLKLFISLSQQPVPDITHQQTDIHSELKFFFNDDDLMIYTYNCNKNNKQDCLLNERQNIVSIMHDPQFQSDIKQIYEQWITRKQDNTQKLYSQSSQNKIDCSKQYKNFIAFVDFWLTKISQSAAQSNNPKILCVQYSIYDEMIRSSVEDCLINCIYQVKSSLFQENMLKNQRVNEPKVKDKKTEQKIIKDIKIKEKRFQQYFKHFSAKKQAIASLNTFEQLGIAYSSVDLTQWIRFSKEFINDKINNKSKKQINQIQKDGKRSKKITVRQLKTIFDKISKDNRTLNYEQFRTAVNDLYVLIFKRNENTKEDKIIYNSWLKIDNHENWRMKMKEFGVNVPQNQTHIPNFTKSCKKVSAKYMELFKQKQNQCNSRQNSDLVNNRQTIYTRQTKQNTVHKLKNTKISLNPVISPNNNLRKSVNTAKTIYNKKKNNNNIKEGTVELNNLLGINSSENNDSYQIASDDDEFLSSYHHKSGIAVLRRIDNRIQKFTNHHCCFNH